MLLDGLLATPDCSIPTHKARGSRCNTEYRKVACVLLRTTDATYNWTLYLCDTWAGCDVTHCHTNAASHWFPVSRFGQVDDKGMQPD